MSLMQIIRNASLTGTASQVRAALVLKNIPKANHALLGWRGVGRDVSSLLSGRITKYFEVGIAATLNPAQLSESLTNSLPQEYHSEVTEEKIDALHFNLKNALSSYQGDGFDFAEEQIQKAATLLGVAQIWPSDHVTAVKALGVYQVSLVEQANLADPTEQEVQAALDEIEADRKKRVSTDADNGVQSLLTLTPTTSGAGMVASYATTLRNGNCITDQQLTDIKTALGLE